MQNQGTPLQAMTFGSQLKSIFLPSACMIILLRCFNDEVTSSLMQRHVIHAALCLRPFLVLQVSGNSYLPYYRLLQVEASVIQHASDDKRPKSILEPPGQAQAAGIIRCGSLPQNSQEKEQDAEIGDVAPGLQAQGEPTFKNLKIACARLHHSDRLRSTLAMCVRYHQKMKRGSKIVSYFSCLGICEKVVNAAHIQESHSCDPIGESESGDIATVGYVKVGPSRFVPA